MATGKQHEDVTGRFDHACKAEAIVTRQEPLSLAEDGLMSLSRVLYEDVRDLLVMLDRLQDALGPVLLPEQDYPVSSETSPDPTVRSPAYQTFTGLRGQINRANNQITHLIDRADI